MDPGRKTLMVLMFIRIAGNGKRTLHALQPISHQHVLISRIIRSAQKQAVNVLIIFLQVNVGF
jgi:hypothetical protein